MCGARGRSMSPMTLRKLAAIAPVSLALAGPAAAAPAATEPFDPGSAI
jgi:hypothetical protein